MLMQITREHKLLPGKKVIIEDFCFQFSARKNQNNLFIVYWGTGLDCPPEPGPGPGWPSKGLKCKGKRNETNRPEERIELQQVLGVFYCIVKAFDVKRVL